jgi:hypothetical protein
MEATIPQAPMPNNRNEWFWFIGTITIMVILFLLFLRQCDKMEQIKTGTDNSKPQLLKTDTFYRDIVKPQWHSLPPIEHWHVDTIHHFVEVPAKIDTLAIIRAYFSEYRYRDTTQDSNIVITNDLFISQNEIVKDSSKTSYKILREKVITNTYQAPPKRYVSIGGGIGVSPKYVMLNIGASFTDKHKRNYILSYDLLNKTVQANVYFKIGK